ncbi:hypothetical protein CHELA41_23563 [Hyphomicrobiales bacterium]|nr:hypothetical protein CHELA41_23563 [Hyphomicrobiales bacterium]
MERHWMTAPINAHMAVTAIITRILKRVLMLMAMARSNISVGFADEALQSNCPRCAASSSSSGGAGAVEVLVAI